MKSPSFFLFKLVHGILSEFYRINFYDIRKAERCIVTSITAALENIEV